MIPVARVLSLAAVVALCVILSCLRNGAWKTEALLWRDVTVKSPLVARAWYNLANSEKDAALALRYYSTAIAIRPSYAEAHYNLGVVMEALSDSDGAISEYRRALAVRPSFVEARNNLGYAYFKKGLLNEAATEYLVALKYAPDDADIRFNLASVYARKGLNELAIAELQVVLRLRPGDKSALEALSVAVKRNSTH